MNMNPESPTSHPELEARITALLLGELPPEEAVDLEQVIAADPRLGEIRQKIETVLPLVRKATLESRQPSLSATPLKLSGARRDDLLAQFKTVKPKEFASKPRRESIWLVGFSIAATVLILAAIAVSRTASRQSTARLALAVDSDFVAVPKVRSRAFGTIPENPPATVAPPPPPAEVALSAMDQKSEGREPAETLMQRHAAISRGSGIVLPEQNAALDGLSTIQPNPTSQGLIETKTYQIESETLKAGIRQGGITAQTFGGGINPAPEQELDQAKKEPELLQKGLRDFFGQNGVNLDAGKDKTINLDDRSGTLTVTGNKSELELAGAITDPIKVVPPEPQLRTRFKEQSQVTTDTPGVQWSTSDNSKSDAQAQAMGGFGGSGGGGGMEGHGIRSYGGVAAAAGVVIDAPTSLSKNRGITDAFESKNHYTQGKDQDSVITLGDTASVGKLFYQSPANEPAPQKLAQATTGLERSEAKAKVDNNVDFAYRVGGKPGAVPAGEALKEAAMKDTSALGMDAAANQWNFGLNTPPAPGGPSQAGGSIPASQPALIGGAEPQSGEAYYARLSEPAARSVAELPALADNSATFSTRPPNADQADAANQQKLGYVIMNGRADTAGQVESLARRQLAEPAKPNAKQLLAAVPTSTPTPVATPGASFDLGGIESPKAGLAVEAELRPSATPQGLVVSELRMDPAPAKEKLASGKDSRDLSLGARFNEPTSLSVVVSPARKPANSLASGADRAGLSAPKDQDGDTLAVGEKAPPYGERNAPVDVLRKRVDQLGGTTEPADRPASLASRFGRMLTGRQSGADDLARNKLEKMPTAGGRPGIVASTGQRDYEVARATPAYDGLSDSYSKLQGQDEKKVAEKPASPMNAATITSEEAFRRQSSTRELQLKLAAAKPTAPIAPPAAQLPAAPVNAPQPEVSTASNAFSTFSLNVTDVGFKLAAASLEKGALPEAATVRSEEFLNAFNYHDPEPTAGAPIGFVSERARDPFAQNRDLLRFAVKTAAAGRQPGIPLNLVLLLDNSGSMERADRVEIMHEALKVLASQLKPQDKFSIVTFARTARLWVDGLPGDQAGGVVEQVAGLTPQGGTNLEEAMRVAYETAARHYSTNGINRVVLMTDGAANLGDVNPDDLQRKVEAQRKQGIALDCFGIGWEGYNDDLLEQLSRHGDGRYGFLNSPSEAANGFAQQLAGALQVAASDVKVQVEFNPKRVTYYRQIGYAKHQLTKEQFRDNTVDAAEIGAAESGNGMYVVEVNPRGEGPLCTVRVRYKKPGTSEYPEHAWEVPYTGNALPLAQSSPAMRLAATAAAFSEWLVSSPYAAEVTTDQLLSYLAGVPEACGADARPKQLEWMIRQAKSLTGK